MFEKVEAAQAQCGSVQLQTKLQKDKGFRGKRTEIVSSISKSEIEPEFGHRRRPRQQDGGEQSQDALFAFSITFNKNF